MMHFKTLNAAGILAFVATFFTACSDENHAGVLTETESGTTIASIEGLVRNEKGETVSSAKVDLISTSHIAARMVPLKTTTTNKDGVYTIDSVSAGSYALQISNTEHTQSGYQTITIEDDKTNTQKLKPETSLEENASLELILNTYALDKGDTLCITGTLNCVAIGDKEVKAGTVSMDEIPPTEFTRISFIRASDHKLSNSDVKWDFVPGETLEVETFPIEVTIPESAMEMAKKQNEKQTIDSMIVPVSFNTSLKNPVLVNDKGDTLALYKIEEDKDSNRYLTVIPNIDVGTYKFTVFPCDSIIPTKQISKAYGETKTDLTITESVYQNSLTTQGNSIGISFWIQEKGAVNKDSIYIESQSNDVIYLLETNDKPDELCANFYKRYSTDSNYTKNYFNKDNSFCHKVLDGKRHHYTLFIRNNLLVIAIDGIIVENSTMKNSFYNIPGFTVGSHKLEDLIVFSLGYSITQANSNSWDQLHAWLYAFYTLQK